MADTNTKAPRSKGRKAAQFVYADEVELLPPTRVESPLARWGPMVMVAVLSFVAYIPAIDNEFVTWDDDHYIFDNRQVSEPDGLKSIWGDVLWYSEPRFQRTHEKRVSHQYYPMVFTLFWIEYRLFGGDDTQIVTDKSITDENGKPVKRSKTIEDHINDKTMTASGFHVSSMVLHALAGVVLIALFRCLGVSNWVAWAAAIMFGVHPLQASSVAWAAEVKNILSLLFYMLAMMAYVKHRRTGNWWYFGLALVSFQCALFSKTVALTLPVMLFFTDRLLERQWNWTLVQRSVLRAIPFLALSIIAASTTISVEDRNRTIPITDQQRPLVAGAVLLFYPYKMLVPINQSPIYRLWDPDLADIRWYLPLLLSAGFIALIIRYRHKLGPHFIWAALLYGVTQVPMLGFKNINYFQFAFVADHYFYHGSIALFLMLALGLDFARRAIKPPATANVAITALVCAAVVVLGARTWFYCDYWQTRHTFWERVIAVNDRCWPAYYNTANAWIKEASELRAQGEEERARELAEKAEAYYKRVADIHQQIRQPFDQLIRVAIWQKDWAKALDVSDRAVQRFPGVTDFLDKGCDFAMRARMYDVAINRCNLAADTFERSKSSAGRQKQIGDFRGYAAQAATNIERWDVALAQATKAAKNYERAKQQGSQANALLLAANAAEKLGRFDDAAKLYNEAAAIYDAAGQPLQAIRARGQAGAALKKAGRDDQAEATFTESLQLCIRVAQAATQQGRPDAVGTALLEAGNVCTDAGWRQRAERYYQQAGQAFIEAADTLTNEEQHCQALRQYKLAVVACDAVVNMEPTDEGAKRNLQNARDRLSESRKLCKESRK